MGGDLAMQHLLGWQCKGYVEIDDYCQRLIRQRQDDGLIDRAPIFGDIRAFIGDGYADSYQGVVDCVTGGFPCQPFSSAGKRRGADDERNMWPATVGVLRAVRPRYAFLENVRGLLSSGYFGRILGDLCESGYDARWRILSAAEVGAPHKRDRLWIVADAHGDRRDTGGQGKEGKLWATRDSAVASGEQREDSFRGSYVADTTDKGFSHGTAIEMGGPESKQEPERQGWWSTEPDVGRVANGVASRVDRLKALGNGQVPLVAATAWRLLSGGQ